MPILLNLFITFVGQCFANKNIMQKCLRFSLFQRIYSNFFVPIPTLLIHQTKLFCFVFIRLELTFTKRRNNLHLLLCSSFYAIYFALNATFSAVSIYSIQIQILLPTFENICLVSINFANN